MPANRYVDLWLGEFEQDPHELAATLSAHPVILARKGDPHGLRQLPARRNLLVFRHSFTIETPWPDAIDSLMASLDGWDEVRMLIERLRPKQPLVQFTLPIRNSPHQEGNVIEPPMLARLAGCGLAIGFEFGEY